jgi:hypothetical protein
MKTLTLAILLLLQIVDVKSQYIGFDELLKFHELDDSEITQKLLEKDWTYRGITKEKVVGVTEVVEWCHSYAYTNELGSVCRQFLTVYKGDNKQIAYDFENYKHYLQIVKRIETLGLKKVKVTAGTNSIYTIYHGKRYSISTSVSNSNRYVIRISKL